MGLVRKFLTTLCPLYSFINALNIELFKKKKHFREWGGGEGGGGEERWVGE